MSNDVAMALFETVAGSSEPLSPLVQAMLSTYATKAKSSAGDRVLVALGKREDLSDQARTAIESSSRAAVKAAWLSHADLPAGYVEEAVAKEKRVTVLAAVAAHPDASTELLQLLAARDQVAVAVALLGRPDLSDELALPAIRTLGAKVETLSWGHKRLWHAEVVNRPGIVSELLLGTASVGQMRALLGLRLDIPTECLSHATRVALSDSEYILERSANSGFSGPGKLLGGIERLLEARGWQPGSPEDIQVARVVNALSRNMPAGRCNWWPAARSVMECHARNFGTRVEQQAAVAARAKREAELRKAETTTDQAVIAVLAHDRDLGIIDALARNGNVRLENLGQDVPLKLIAACVARGDDALQAAALCTLDPYGRYSDLYPYADSDAKTVAQYAIAHMRSGTPGALPYWRLARLLCNEKLVSHVIPELSSAEVAAVLETTSDNSGVDRVAIGNILSQLLSTGLVNADQWGVFTALVSDMESPLGESIAVAGSV